MSTCKGPLLRAMLVERWPDRYQSMSLWRALLTMQRTGRVYQSDTVLADPRTGRVWPTLGATLGATMGDTLGDTLGEAPAEAAAVRAEPTAGRRAGKLAIDLVQSG